MLSIRTTAGLLRLTEKLSSTLMETVNMFKSMRVDESR